MNTDSFYITKRKAAYISLVVGFLMLIAKMGAYLITGSTAIFSDAVESIVHIFATTMALVSIIISSKPADSDHMYGHGNIEYFSAGIEGTLILGASVIIIYQSITDILYGSELSSLNIGVIVIAGAGVINLFLGSYLVKTGKKTNSLTLIADGKHILTDSATSIGVVVGIALVILTDLIILDPIVAIIVALNILRTGFKLIRTSIGGLMLETNPEVLLKISQLLSKFKKDYWIDIHELRYWKSGDKFFIDFHMILPFYFTIAETHSEEKEITERFKEELSNAQLKVHFDYCRYELCKYCSHQSCEERKEEKSVNFDWDVEKLTGDAVFRIHD